MCLTMAIAMKWIVLWTYLCCLLTVAVVSIKKLCPQLESTNPWWCNLVLVQNRNSAEEYILSLGFLLKHANIFIIKECDSNLKIDLHKCYVFNATNEYPGSWWGIENSALRNGKICVGELQILYAKMEKSALEKCQKICIVCSNTEITSRANWLNRVNWEKLCVI